jgi:alkylhydroperoxidase family enzyme
VSRVRVTETEGNSFERAMANRPEILEKWSELDALMRFSGTLDPHLKEEVRRSLAPGIGCVFCASLGEPAAEHAKQESLAIAYAQMLLDDPRAIEDSTFDVLREEFSDEQIVELTAWSLFMIAGQAFGAVMKLPPATPEELEVYLQWRRDGEAAAASAS